MPVQRLNHAVLYVRDVERSHAFYRDVLGFRVKMEIPGAAVFLQADGSTNDHDLGLFQIGSGAGASEAPAAAPTWNRPRSWSLVDPSACRNTAAPGISVFTRKPRTSR